MSTYEKGEVRADDSPRFTNIAQIRKANKEAGMFWFSPATVKAFKSRVESRIFDEGTSEDYPQGSRLWVESTTTYDDSAREYKVARFDVSTGDISWVFGPDYSRPTFDTKAEAVAFLEGVLAGGAS